MLHSPRKVLSTYKKTYLCDVNILEYIKTILIFQTAECFNAKIISNELNNLRNFFWYYTIVH